MDCFWQLNFPVCVFHTFQYPATSGRQELKFHEGDVPGDFSKNLLKKRNYYLYLQQYNFLSNYW